MTPKPSEIIDRDREWGILDTINARSRPDLVFVVGRRRVGKSFVLSRFSRASGGIYYQATRRTEAEQLAGLSRAVGDFFDDPALQQGVAFPTWETLLDYVTERATKESFFFVLDEFPYLASAAPALPSILQYYWDHRWPQTRMKLILSGSYITAMTRLEQADQPLYGRRTAKLLFKPFDLPHVTAFVPDYSVRDRLLTFGLFGHLPGHLSLLDPGRSLKENVEDLLLDPMSRLVDDAQHMLDAFLGDADVYYSILQVVASGEQTWSGITKRVGRSGGSLTRPMQWLEDMGLLERVVPITEKNPGRSKRVRYRITDPYVAFWHRVISPLLQAGSLGLVSPGQLWDEVVEPDLDPYMGPIFESLCRDFVRSTDRLPFRPLRVGEWWSVNSDDQLDVVATGKDDVLIGEAKWGCVTGHDLALLRRRASQLMTELPGLLHVHLVLFTARGEMDEIVRAAADAGDVIVYTGEVMVEERAVSR